MYLQMMKALNRILEASGIPSVAGGIEPGPVVVAGLTPCLQRTLVFDALQVGSVNRTNAVTESASGKGTNVARIVMQLGGAAALVTPLGGSRGELFLNYLKSELPGMRVAPVTVPEDMRICQTLIDTQKNQVTELVEESAPLDSATLACIETGIGQYLKQSTGGILVLSGSPPPGSDSGLYARWVGMFQSVGARVFVDSQKGPLQKAIEASPWLVKANQEEWEATLGRKLPDSESRIAALLQVLDKGVTMAVMSLGGNGALMVSRQGHALGKHPSLECLNPIGSGDAMMAGMALAAHCGGDCFSALKLGLACGMANTLSLTSGSLTRDDVIGFVPEIDLELL